MMPCLSEKKGVSKKNMEKILFQPIEIKGMKLKNRLGFPPFLNVPMGKDGSITDLTLRWFEMQTSNSGSLLKNSRLPLGVLERSQGRAKIIGTYPGSGQFGTVRYEKKHIH